VELHAALERVLELGRGDGERLQEPEHVGEPQADEADVTVLARPEHVLLLLVHGAAMLSATAGEVTRCYPDSMERLRLAGAQINPVVGDLDGNVEGGFGAPPHARAPRA